jgi:hypothetical protein
MLDVWAYLKWKSEKNPSFSGLRYYLTLGTSILAVFGLFLLGASQMYFRIFPQGRVLLFTIYFAWLLLLIVGFGWMDVWERFRDPYQFLARYCAIIQTTFLVLILSSTITYAGRSITLYEFTLHHPSDSSWIHFFILTSLVLCVIYLTPIGRNRWITGLSGISALANIVLISAITVQFHDRWDTYGLAIWFLTLFLILGGVFPQLYWAQNPRKSKPAGPDSGGNYRSEERTEYVELHI